MRVRVKEEKGERKSNNGSDTREKRKASLSM